MLDTIKMIETCKRIHKQHMKKQWKMFSAAGSPHEALEQAFSSGMISYEESKSLENNLAQTIKEDEQYLLDMETKYGDRDQAFDTYYTDWFGSIRRRRTKELSTARRGFVIAVIIMVMLIILQIRELFVVHSYGVGYGLLAIIDLIFLISANINIRDTKDNLRSSIKDACKMSIKFFKSVDDSIKMTKVDIAEIGRCLEVVTKYGH